MRLSKQMCVKWAAHCQKYRQWFINPRHWHCDLGLREWLTVHAQPHGEQNSGSLLTQLMCVTEGWALRKVCGNLLWIARDTCVGLCETVCSVPFSIFTSLFWHCLQRKNSNALPIIAVISSSLSPALLTRHGPSTAQLWLASRAHKSLSSAQGSWVKHMSWHLPHQVEPGFWVHWLLTVPSLLPPSLTHPRRSEELITAYLWPTAALLFILIHRCGTVTSFLQKGHTFNNATS